MSRHERVLLVYLGLACLLVIVAALLTDVR